MNTSVAASIYVVSGLLMMALGIWLYLDRRPIEGYVEYLRRTMGNFLSWPGSQEWKELQWRWQSVTFRFGIPGFLVGLGFLAFVLGATALL
jgi:hypothetical protein